MPVTFPTTGTSLAELDAEMDSMLAGDPEVGLGGISGPEDVRRVAAAAFGKFIEHNALLGPRLPSIWRMQTEVLEMSLDLMHGGPGAAASMTTGGSESIFCAVHAMRERARVQQPEVTQPELVVPYSAHAAFSKSCHYLGLRIVRVALGDDYRADVEAMEAAIGPNTIGLVGSAPCWPYGRYDPIPELAALASRHGLWMHVDACVGGFISPFARQLGVEMPDWDLQVPGVCSISADLHKYGFAPKPCSVVLYASKELHAYQPHVVEDWPTGPYRTETVVGSRAAGAIAGAWAVFRYQGHAGFLRSTGQILSNKQQLEAGIREIAGLEVFETDLCQVMFSSSSEMFDTQVVAGGLRERGWFVFGVQEPPMISMALGAVESEVVERFLDDLEALVAGITERTRGAGELTYAS